MTAQPTPGEVLNGESVRLLLPGDVLEVVEAGSFLLGRGLVDGGEATVRSVDAPYVDVYGPSERSDNRASRFKFLRRPQQPSGGQDGVGECWPEIADALYRYFCDVAGYHGDEAGESTGDVMERPAPLLSALFPREQPEPVACVACEGKPTGENNPCAVCGLHKQPAGIGHLHTAAMDAIRKDIVRQHPGAFTEDTDAEIVVPVGAVPVTLYVKIDVSALAEAVLPLYAQPSKQTGGGGEAVERLTKALSDMTTFYGQPEHAVTDGQRKANRAARALLKELRMDADVTWAETAKALGWKWSAADDAFVHDKMPDTPSDAQDCCALNDIETLSQARAILAALSTPEVAK